MLNTTATIAFYCSSISWGGLEMNTVRYARWMSDRGWKVKVFCVVDSPIHKQVMEQGLEIVLIKRNRKYFDLLQARRVSKLFMQHDIALCWFRDTRDFDLLGWVKRWSGGKLKLLYQQAMQFGVSKKDFLHTFRFKQVDAWISTLDFLADQVKKQTHFPHERIHVIPLGVDTSAWEIETFTPTDARKELGLPEKAMIAGIIGRIDPLKGQHVAMEAFMNLAHAFPNLHLLIFGESTLNEGNEYEKRLHERAASSEFRDRIHFRPYSKSVQRFYQSIDMFLLCSKGETFGTVTIEAMSFGKPVIATDSSGSPEILDGGRCGVLFEPGNAKALANAMQKIIEQPDFAANIADNGRRQFESKFAAKSSLDALEKVVRQLLHK